MLKTMSLHQYPQCQFNTTEFILAPSPFLLSLSITPSLTVRKLAFIVLNTLVIVSVKNTSAGWGQAVSAAWQKVSEPKVGEEGGHLCRGREVSGPK